MSIKTFLFDDGAIDHSDIKANDGIWSNTLSFTRNGRAKARLVMTGTAKGVALILEKDIGEFVVADPGNIYVKVYDHGIWARPGNSIKIGLNLKNDSEFKERILFSLDESIGSLSQNHLDLDAKSDQDYDLTILLDPDLDYKTYDLVISGKPMEATSNIHGGNIEVDIEVVTRIEGLKREIMTLSSILLWSIGLLLGLPLLIYILGILLYGILVKSQLKVRGRLIYWDEFNLENKTEIDLSSYKKNRVTITFKDQGQADYRISDSSYNHDIIIYMDLVRKRSKFMLGWMSLLSKKATSQILMETSQPGIVEYDGNIFTKMNLYDGSVFVSGEYAFKYIRAKTILNKEIDEGKNILEGKI